MPAVHGPGPWFASAHQLSVLTKKLIQVYITHLLGFFLFQNEGNQSRINERLKIVS